MGRITLYQYANVFSKLNYILFQKTYGNQNTTVTCISLLKNCLKNEIVMNEPL